MKVLMTIPLDLYRDLETHCEEKHEHYRLMKNAVIAPERDRISLRCETERALQFIAWVNETCPGSSGKIEVFPD
jgi:hypothetical protein